MSASQKKEMAISVHLLSGFGFVYLWNVSIIINDRVTVG